jgi:8-oxo-dGTP pyrophosphatase MutT (NUDIX family)
MSAVPNSEQRRAPITVVGDTELTVVNPHLTVAHERVRFPNGHEGDFAYVKDPSVATSVVPYDKRRGKIGVVLVEQYRHPSRSWGWEIPAGGVNPGETSQQGAARELVEESGFEAGLWQQLPSQNTFIGRGNTKVDTHLAADLRKTGTAHDAEEVIRAVEWFPMERVHEMMMDGGINSSHTLGALALAHVFLQANPDNPIAQSLR